MDVGKRIKELRKEFNISSKELTKKAGISQPVLSKLENNQRKADIEIIEKICTALNISLKDFFDIQNKTNSSLLKLTSHAKKLNPDQLEKLTEFIKSINNKS
ncbi:helix-turn-helix transcriptional regulator [Crassaminicella thermophila]|uniref:Helix-turn-helix transcriptional regulator n=1 Tax=Crassaminicella thermophila TaxID=2599308 RepID=A0A5C0SE01_CRATE|nr:helix-turn-helix transcriptional regulator [Crassaminicella thermophila]QEK11548.1 helix-turn-helix transcriptional regulator [Crassaminicella thermophila]